MCTEYMARDYLETLYRTPQVAASTTLTWTWCFLRRQEAALPGPVCTTYGYAWIGFQNLGEARVRAHQV